LFSGDIGDNGHVMLPHICNYYWWIFCWLVGRRAGALLGRLERKRLHLRYYRTTRRRSSIHTGQSE